MEMASFMAAALAITLAFPTATLFDNLTKSVMLPELRIYEMIKK